MNRPAPPDNVPHDLFSSLTIDRHLNLQEMKEAARKEHKELPYDMLPIRAVKNNRVTSKIFACA